MIEIPGKWQELVLILRLALYCLTMELSRGFSRCCPAFWPSFVYSYEFQEEVQAWIIRYRSLYIQGRVGCGPAFFIWTIKPFGPVIIRFQPSPHDSSQVQLSRSKQSKTRHNVLTLGILVTLAHFKLNNPSFLHSFQKPDIFSTSASMRSYPEVENKSKISGIFF